MKHFYKLFFLVLLAIAALFLTANLCLLRLEESGSRAYRVEIRRIARTIEAEGFDALSLSSYRCVYRVTRSDGSADFYQVENSYALRQIDGQLYRFDYVPTGGAEQKRLLLLVNGLLGLSALFVVSVLLYVHRKLLLPFQKLADVPYRLSKGNLAPPLKETKSRYFGKFLWGVDLLREHLEAQKKRELALQKEKKTLLLSLSHDIKTPLSAIKLSSQALARGLYPEPERQLEVAKNIGRKADEIERYVSQIILASREDFLSLEVTPGEFYLSKLVSSVSDFYEEKLTLLGTEFSVSASFDCLLKGDPDRSVEVLQNLMENAIKYGDGAAISLEAAEEDGCILVSVTSSGGTLPETELPHIFDSFFRGSNAKDRQGSGLGLFICRQLMHKMNGEIFAQLREGSLRVTAVFEKA
ncbi:MAG: HAMP domain-containing sensor histidine kinase [Lachnospiraceae bacterium]|nr:HAMP domain-containing sensor histidine kinase [Lachnospiraceae bacterium]